MATEGESQAVEGGCKRRGKGSTTGDKGERVGDTHEEALSLLQMEQEEHEQAGEEKRGEARLAFPSAKPRRSVGAAGWQARREERLNMEAETGEEEMEEERGGES